MDKEFKIARRSTARDVRTTKLGRRDQGTPILVDDDANVLPNSTQQGVGTKLYPWLKGHFATLVVDEVSISGAAAVGQVLTSTSATAATWQAPAGAFIQAAAASFTPSASTTYYFGTSNGESPTTTAALHRIYVGRAGTLTRVDYFHYCGVNGSAGGTAVSVRINNTTDVFTANMSSTAATGGATASVTGSQALAVGDYIEIKLFTPAWATPPIAERWSATLTIT